MKKIIKLFEKQPILYKCIECFNIEEINTRFPELDRICPICNNIMIWCCNDD